jgi:hypothetical protein
MRRRSSLATTSSSTEGIRRVDGREEGIIRAADVNADYTIRPEPSDTVRLLETLRK